jgi:DNA-binding NtrC family response regulator
MAQAARLAQRAGARVTQADDLRTALATLRAQPGMNAILCDAALDIAALVRAITAERIVVPIIAAGAALTPAQAQRAMRDGAQDVLPLPPDPDLLAALLLGAPQSPAPQSPAAPNGASPSGASPGGASPGGASPNVAPPNGAPPNGAHPNGAHPNGAPVVRDPAMLAVLRRAEQVAPSEASVLITGESGTGKEVLARHIHARSRRATGPFIALNCAAIPENLLESELFGHEKGAFSGALARRIGRFEAAQGGTLLLDEISEMDIRLQAKLLRALQEREIDRVGGTAPVRVNVRILATSNRDLPAEAAAGRFREDLFFRLNVVGLRIPPLRERPADIPALADHYARHYAALNGLPERPLGADAKARLLAHAWRGNVRELENTLHSAVLLATGAEIGADAIELPHAPRPTATSFGATSFGATSPAATSPGATSPATPPGGSPFVGRRMEDVERDVILHTLTHTAGNRTHAATVLGISIRALRNKLRDYAAAGIAVPPPGVAA